MSLDQDRIDQFNDDVEREAKELGLLPADDESSPSGTDSTETEQKDENKPEREYTEVELEQMELGWDPNKSGPNVVSAEEFKRVGQIIEAKRAASKRAEVANKEVQQLTKTVQQLVEHNKKVEKAAYEKAKRELEVQKEQLILEADVEGVRRLELEQEVIQKNIEHVDKIQAPVEQTMTQEAVDYVERNKFWLHGTSPEDKKMQIMTNKVIDYLKEAEPNITEVAAIAFIEQEIKSKFPNRFENENKTKAAAVMKSKSSSTGDSSGLSLSRDERDSFLAIQKVDPSYTLKEYVKQLELIGRRS